MKFKTLSGGLKRLPRSKKYLISWTKKSRSLRQFETKKFLKEYWENYAVFEEFPVAGTKMTLDFYNSTKKIAIEVQGEQHTKYVPFFHGSSRGNFASQLRRDERKSQFCNINGIKLVEVYPGDDLNKKLFTSQGVHL
jgi:hypothetical protein